MFTLNVGTILLNYKHIAGLYSDLKTSQVIVCSCFNRKLRKRKLCKTSPPSFLGELGTDLESDSSASQSMEEERRDESGKLYPIFYKDTAQTGANTPDHTSKTQRRQFLTSALLNINHRINNWKMNGKGNTVERMRIKLIEACRFNLFLCLSYFRP